MPAPGQTGAPFRDPRNVLKLRRCPRCDYNLEGLPRSHICPECGFAYDASMFVLYGWPRRSDRPVLWRALLSLAANLPVVIFLFYLAFATPRFSVWPGSLVIPLLVALYLFWAVTWIQKRRLRIAGIGMIQLCFSSSGAGARFGKGKPHFIPWRRFRDFRFRRAGRGAWRLRLSCGLWRELLTVPFVRRVEPHKVSAIIECSRREAALIRSEIRRRLRASNQSLPGGTEHPDKVPSRKDKFPTLGDDGVPTR